MMKSIYTTLIAIIVMGSTLKAQSLERSVIGSAGSSAAIDSFTIDYTVGESMVPTLGSPAVWLLQGFHQPISSTYLSTDELSQLNFNVYPNPFSNNIMLKLESNQTANIQVYLTDIFGKIVLAETLSTFNTTHNEFNIATGHLSPGTYMLSVMANGQNDQPATIKTKQLTLIR